MNKIYLDNAATTPLSKEVLNEMLPYLTSEYGNPGSFHYMGLSASEAIENARLQISKVLNSKPQELIFTAGGTESINLAIKGIAHSLKEKGNHIITSSIEHHAVTGTCEFLQQQGYSVTYLPVDSEGIVNPDDVKNAITPQTILISIMYANNEIGVIQPISQIGAIAKENNIPFHVDACQAAGALDLDVSSLNVDLLTLNASKVYGPKGVGLLYIKSGIEIEPLIHGGGQENGMRSGTENVAGIVGFAKALEIAHSTKESENARQVHLRDTLIAGLLRIPKTRLNGHPIKRLPNNVNVTFLDIEGESILLYLNELNIFASTGSACASKSLETSHVLRAIGLPYEASHGSMRFTLGIHTTQKDIDEVLSALPNIVQDLRKISPLNMKMEHFNGA